MIRNLTVPPTPCFVVVCADNYLDPKITTVEQYVGFTTVFELPAELPVTSHSSFTAGACIEMASAVF